MLSSSQQSDYHAHGHLVLDGLFSEDEMASCRAGFEELVAADSPELIRESGTGAVRGHHGAHLRHPLFADLVRLERLVRPAEALLGSRVYVHQFKMNAKRALVGDVWEWHQDFQFWHAEDGMPEPRAVSFGIFMDDVGEFNGPLMFADGSHLAGLQKAEERPGSDWETTLASKLRYTIEAETLASATTGRDIVAPKGKRGTAVLFDPRILHASAPNMSPHDRRMIFVSYNSVENPLLPVPAPRPEFVAARDFTPVSATADSTLLDRHRTPTR